LVPVHRNWWVFTKFIEPVWPITPKHQGSVNSPWKAFSAHIGPVWCLGVKPGSKNIKELTLNSWFYAGSFMKTTSSLKFFKNLVLSWKPPVLWKFSQTWFFHENQRFFFFFFGNFFFKLNLEVLWFWKFSKNQNLKLLTKSREPHNIGWCILCSRHIILICLLLYSFMSCAFQADQSTDLQTKIMSNCDWILV
jgi:hypothetical protein